MRFMKGSLKGQGLPDQNPKNDGEPQESHLELFTWYGHPISLGPIEGANNRIKTMKRQVSGYRDMEFFGMETQSIVEVKYVFG